MVRVLWGLGLIEGGEAGKWAEIHHIYNCIKFTGKNHLFSF